MLPRWPLPGASPAMGSPPAPATAPSDTQPGSTTPPSTITDSLEDKSREGGQQAADHHAPHRPFTCSGDNLRQRAKVSQLTNLSFSLSLPLLQSHLCKGLALPRIPSAGGELPQLNASLSHRKHEGRAHRGAPLPPRVKPMRFYLTALVS